MEKSLLLVLVLISAGSMLILSLYLAYILPYSLLPSAHPTLTFLESSPERITFTKENILVTLEKPQLQSPKIAVKKDLVYISGIQPQNATVYIQHPPLGRVFTLPQVYYCPDNLFDPETLTCKEWQPLQQESLQQVCDYDNETGEEICRNETVLTPVRP
ncbi:MAG: hypothetical protein DRP12_01375, partial [Candidatus Aenigmatarchaeota archaeon]